MALTKSDLNAIDSLLTRRFKEFQKVVHGGIVDTLVDIVLPQIDELAVKMEKGFGQIDNRFDKLDERLDRHGKVLESHEKRTKLLERKRNIKLS